jgi:hypothetical protein
MTHLEALTAAEAVLRAESDKMANELALMQVRADVESELRASAYRLVVAANAALEVIDPKAVIEKVEVPGFVAIPPAVEAIPFGTGTFGDAPPTADETHAAAPAKAEADFDASDGGTAAGAAFAAAAEAADTARDASLDAAPDTPPS